MSQLEELLKQKAALESEIARLRKAERDQAIAKIKSLMLDYDLTPADLGKVFRVQRLGSPAMPMVAPKYRDPESGKTWTGRGLMPKWMRAKVEAGQSKESFAI